MSARRPRTMRIDERNVVERPAVTARKPSAAQLRVLDNLIARRDAAHGIAGTPAARGFVATWRSLLRLGWVETVRIGNGFDWRDRATPAGREAARHAP